MRTKKAFLKNAGWDLLLLLAAGIVSAQAQKVPVIVIGMEFPLTDPTGSCGNRGNTQFPSSIVQLQTDKYGTRRVFTSAVTNFVFGTSNSVADYYSKNSYGNLTLENAGIFGPYQADKTADHYWAESENECDSWDKTKGECTDSKWTDQDGDGWTDGHEEKRAEAIQTFITEEIDVRKSFDLSIYDTNQDGTVTREELAVVVIFPQKYTWGDARGAKPEQGSDDPFTAGSVDWNLSGSGDVVEMYTANFSGSRDLGLLAHELAHVIIDAGDMYENASTLPKATPPGWDPSEPGPFSLMDDDSYHSHLDPLHKIHAGNWATPISVTKDGYYKLRSVEETADIYKLEDPNSHGGEYFLVENRQLVNYDNLLPTTGLAIWHIDEGRLGNWRTAMEMEPVVSMNPINYKFYLWAGSSQDWCNTSSPDSKWHDNTKSGIGVWAVSASSQTMQAYFDVPGPGVLVQAVPEQAQGAPGSTVQYGVRLVNTGSSADQFTLSVSGLESGWASLNPSSVNLSSYQDYRFVDLSVAVPKCTSEGSTFFSITATSATDPKITTTCSAELVVKVPGLNLSADAYEANNSFNTAKPVNLGSPQGAFYSSSAELKSLTLHTGSDVDFFKISYQGGAAGECGIPSGGSSLAPFRPKVVKGSVVISAKDTYCRPMDMEIYSSSQSFYNKYHTADDVVIECPTSIFSDQTLYLAVKNPQKRTMEYSLTVTYAYGYCSLSDPLVSVGKVKKQLLKDPPYVRFFDPLSRIVDFDRFARESKEYLPAFGEYRSKTDKATWQYLLGQVSQLSRRFDDAEGFYKRSLDGFNELGNTPLAACVLRSLGELYSAQGKEAEAVSHFNQAYELHQTLDDESELAADGIALGRYYLAKGETAKAMGMYQGALSLQEKGSDVRGKCLTLLSQSEAFLFLNHQEAAVASLMLAEACLSQIGDQDLRGEFNRQKEALQSRIGESQYPVLRARLSGRADAVRQQAAASFTGR